MTITTQLPTDTIPWQDKAGLPQTTLRSTIAGLTIGSIILISNFQFGLQTGWVSMMSLPSALLGFAIFKSLQDKLDYRFTDVENVFVQSVSVAVATGPLAYGFVGIIPAIEKMMTNEESGYADGINIISLWKLVLWSLGLAFFGVFFAVPLRKQFIIKDKLPFPSGSATATLISVFHGTSIKVDENTKLGVDRDPCGGSIREEEDFNNIERRELPENPNNITIIESQDLCQLKQAESYENNIKLLMVTSGLSSAYTIVSYFIPQIRSLPIFGTKLSKNYLLNFQPSPAYVGQGIIMGVATTSYMFFGMVLGWCILGPMAQSKGWAPGRIDDWKEGAEGWIMWISLSIMISDSIVSFAATSVTSVISLLKTYAEDYNSTNSKERHEELNRLINDDHDIPSDEDITSSAFHGESNSSTGLCTNNIESGSRNESDAEDLDKPHLVPNSLTYIGLFISCILCVVTTRVVFGPVVPIYATSISVVLSLFLSVLGVKALGETDLNPVSGIGKLSQLLFALIIPRDHPGSILINLISGAISEAATQQAGDLMQDLKTGYLLGASPRAQFVAQIYGSIYSIFLSAVMYKVYNALYEIPGPIFKTPTAVIWIDCARLVNGAGLPEKVFEFAIVFGIIFGIISFLKNTLSKDNRYYKYLIYLPSGIPVGIGIYNIPSFTLARFIGGIISYFWLRRINSVGGQTNNPEKVMMIIFSSGLILGEGLFSVVNMLFTSMKIPHL